jgi:hydroxyacylglutathione hydrolase
VPVLLVLDDDDALRTALHKLAFVGLDNRVQGYLSGGMDAWSAAGRPQETLAQMSVNELQRALAQGNGMRVLDVREPDEWNDGHVQGAASMSFKVLEQHLADIGIETDEQVAVMCAGGIRSSTACSILLRNGYRRVHNVTGGMSAWKAAELPTVTD